MGKKRKKESIESKAMHKYDVKVRQCYKNPTLCQKEINRNKIETRPCIIDPELCARELSHMECEKKYKQQTQKENCNHGVYLGKVLELD